MKKLISVLILSLGLSQAAVAADVQAPTETKSVEKQQASALVWMKQHPKTTAAITVALVGSAAAGTVYYFRESDFIKPKLASVTSGLTSAKDAVKAFPGKSWTCAKNHPYIAGGSVAAVTVVTAVAIDLARGKNSILRKLGKKEEAATASAK